MYKTIYSPFFKLHKILDIPHILKCDQDRTERIAAVANTIAVAEIEHACTRTIIVIASAFEERIARVRKVRVIVLSLLHYIKLCIKCTRLNFLNNIPIKGLSSFSFLLYATLLSYFLK